MKSTKHEIRSTKQIQNSNDKNSKRFGFKIFNFGIVSNFEFRIFSNRGVSLIEVVIGSAILLLALTGLVGAYNVFVRAGLSTLNTVQASYLLEEGVEAVTTMRDSGWTANIANLTAGADYYLSWNGSRWVSTTTVSKIDNVYTRYFRLTDVSRDANDAIAASGTADAGTKKVTVSVSWQNGATTTTRSVSTYLTNLFGN